MRIPDFIKEMGRRYALSWREKDSSKTGVVPLEKIQTVAVFLDVQSPEIEQAVDHIRKSFSERGIGVTIFTLQPQLESVNEMIPGVVYILKNDLSWCDCPKIGRRHPFLSVGEDMFVSLYRQSSFTLEFIARCSRAKFKIGRSQLPGNIYDFIVEEPEDSQLDQIQAFDNIIDFISALHI